MAAKKSSDLTPSKASLKSKVEKTRVPAKGKAYTLDLRVHSPASLGYYGIDGIDTAPALVSLAKVKGLDVIAVTDFHSGVFVDRVVEAAKNSPVTVIPGVDLRCVLGCCDDLILTCLFPESVSGDQINEFLRELAIPKTAGGDMNYITRVPFDQILRVLNRYDGVALPSRVDRTPNRLMVLPTLIEKYGFRAFDLAYADSVAIFKQRWPKIKFQLFSFSEANSLAQVGSRTARVKMPNAGFAGIRDLVQRG